MHSTRMLIHLALIFVATFAQARPDACRSAWTKNPAFSTQRTVIFKYKDMWITDKQATFSVLEGDDCMNGYIIDSLNVTSKVALPDGSGTVENSGSCKTSEVYSYASDTFPNYNFMREVFNGSNPPGVLELDLSKPACGVRYYPDLKTFKKRFKDHFCKGEVGVDPVAICQHFRHLRSVTR